ncbi:3-oxoadipate enol-lactonase [Pontivivens ytuae]|uniref:3-oxoadipate enol-lactonase n=1 Tax=Pontivivens ytuae TaxID=2789856 RepID=A0A7S9LQV2_9RHOB|nr:3-oxoadipate enol-lactonase [Pontivivens ytuae]QPH53055.1 3-oxoadipate enol-lactonase [Pontivivens ytuae]
MLTFAAANGTTLHYRDEGEGAPIVFINSLGTDFRIWDDVAAALPGRHLRHDKRGHGLSAGVPVSMDDHVADVAALMEGQGTGPAVICGLSVGGMIAQGLAATRPDLVRALILCDTGHLIGTRELWDDRIAAVTEHGIEAIADGILARWFSPTFRETRTIELAGWRQMLTRTPQVGYLATSAAIRDSDFSESTRALRVPTLCVVGEHDGSTPPDLVRELAGLIPGARFEVIAGAGHLPCIEQPAALAALIADFLTTLD